MYKEVKLKLICYTYKYLLNIFSMLLHQYFIIMSNLIGPLKLLFLYIKSVLMTRFVTLCGGKYPSFATGVLNAQYTWFHECAGYQFIRFSHITATRDRFDWNEFIFISNGYQKDRWNQPHLFYAALKYLTFLTWAWAPEAVQCYRGQGPSSQITHNKPHWTCSMLPWPLTLEMHRHLATLCRPFWMTSSSSPR